MFNTFKLRSKKGRVNFEALQHGGRVPQATTPCSIQCFSLLSQPCWLEVSDC